MKGNKLILGSILGLFLVLSLGLVSAVDTIAVEPFETKVLPQVTSTIPLDTEGLDRTYLYCTWHIDNMGEEPYKMTSDKCPATPVSFTFENDETYYARIEAFHTSWDPVLRYWAFMNDAPATAGIREINYVMNQPPEPDDAFFENVLDIIVSQVKNWICAVFPGLDMCTA